MSTTEHTAADGELCTCGRQAVIVYVHDDGRETDYCGRPDGGATAGPCPFCGGERHSSGPCPKYRPRLVEKSRIKRSSDTSVNIQVFACDSSPYCGRFSAIETGHSRRWNLNTGPVGFTVKGQEDMTGITQIRRAGLAERVEPICMNGNHMLAVPPRWFTLILRYEEVMRAAGRPKGTRYLRTYHIRRFASQHKRLKPENVTADHLIAWMAAHDWAPETRKSTRSSLRCFFSWAHSRSLLDSDPSAVLAPISTPPPQPRPAPDTAVDCGLRSADLRVRVAVMIFGFTGMRRAETAAMHTRDLEWIGDGWGVRVLGKGGRERLIPVDELFASAIRALPPGFIFPGQIDGHISPNHLGKLVSAALPDAWTAHNLRHRFASLAYSVERDIRAVQDLLGHARVTTTQIYTYVPDESRRRAAGGARQGLTAA
jgi:integrase